MWFYCLFYDVIGLLMEMEKECDFGVLWKFRIFWIKLVDGLRERDWVCLREKLSQTERERDWFSLAVRDRVWETNLQRYYESVWLNHSWSSDEDQFAEIETEKVMDFWHCHVLGVLRSSSSSQVLGKWRKPCFFSVCFFFFFLYK